MKINCFERMANPNTRVLILGTSPSKASLQSGKYYAHKDNQFWDFMCRILDDEWKPFVSALSLDYSSRCEMLLANGVGVWDVIESCDREGSLDKDIKNVIVNDFGWLSASNIKAIIFNGQKPEKIFKTKYSYLEFGEIAFFTVNSSSPSNGRNPFCKLNEWREAMIPHLT